MLLLKIPALPGPAHNGGAIAIGPDRNLYIIIGNLNAGENKVLFGLWPKTLKMAWFRMGGLEY